MALDHALRDRAAAEGTTILRLYQWSDDTISFGANEAATRHWDRTRIEAARIAVVRRPTGGRAVWHSTSDLTYALTGPLTAYAGARSAYQSIHGHLVAALCRLGLAAECAPTLPRLPGLRRGACFEVAVGGEVLVAGLKVIGSAQLVARDSLLQHGAIARADRLPLLAQFGSERHSSTPAGSWPRLPPVDAITDAIATEWTSRGALPIPDELTTWADAASVKHQARYRDPLWTWRR